MSELLVAGIGCHSRAHYADAQRQTWVPSLTGHHRFFFGQQPNPYLRRALELDEIELLVADDYFSLPDKLQEAIRWSLNAKHHSMFVVDDDTYVNSRNLDTAAADWVEYDWVGRMRPDAPYLSGAAYYLSHRAMEFLANAAKPSAVKKEFGMPAFPYLEGWVFHILRLNGIAPKADRRIRFSSVAADKKVEVEPVETDTVADFEWAGLDMFARHNYQREEKVTPSVRMEIAQSGSATAGDAC